MPYPERARLKGSESAARILAVLDEYEAVHRDDLLELAGLNRAQLRRGVRVLKHELSEGGYEHALTIGMGGDERGIYRLTIDHDRRQGSADERVNGLAARLVNERAYLLNLASNPDVDPTIRAMAAVLAGAAVSVEAMAEV